MNWRIASSVCGAVGLFAIDDDDGPREDPTMPIPVPAPTGCGGWCNSRNRAPDPVKKADT